MMKPIIPFEACVRDTPKFRYDLEEQMANIENLEGKLEKLLKTSHHMMDCGKEYLSAQNSFFNSLSEMGAHFRHDSSIHAAFNKSSACFIELSKFHSTLLDQINRAIYRNLAEFLKKEVKPCKEMRTSFEKLQQEHEACLNRSSSIPKAKYTEAEEAMSAVATAKTSYRSAALDIVQRITLLQEKKRFEVLDNVVSSLNAHKTFFHQGHDFFKEDEFLKNLSTELAGMRARLNKNAVSLLQDKQSLIQNTPDYVVETQKSEVLMSGYLFKRGFSKTFKSWKRRWFELLDKGQLVYRKRYEETPTVLEEDLRICLVRPMADCDRRHCFELISPNKTHMLQAENNEVFSKWVAALQSAISCAIHKSTSPRTRNFENGTPPSDSDSLSKQSRADSDRSKELDNILSLKGNHLCCDCGSPDPEWASVNLGITLCIECSGIHRSLGVHYSKVKSLNLDSWETGCINVMKELGNDVVNSIYSAKADVMDSLGIQKATPDCSNEVRKTWIRAKYVDKAFVAHPKFKENSVKDWKVAKPDFSWENDEYKTSENDSISGESSSAACAVVPNEKISSPSDHAIVLDDDSEAVKVYEDVKEGTAVDPNLLLYKAAKSGNLAVMCEAVALDADKNWTHPIELSTPLHQSILGGVIPASEFLILNGAKVDTVDGSGRTPLFLATEKGHTGQVCVLLKNKADHNISNSEGKKPLDAAIASEHADIVTLLRIAQMNEELTEESSQTEDSFQDIVRDIAQRVHDGNLYQLLSTSVTTTSHVEISSDSSQNCE